MILATLFSGIGAPEFAAREVFDEVETIFACEIDKYARQSYLANHEIDEARFFTDVCDLDARAYAGQIDILIGGSPCQDFSIAGQRAGEDGEIGEVIFDFGSFVVRPIDKKRESLRFSLSELGDWVVVGNIYENKI